MKLFLVRLSLNKVNNFKRYAITFIIVIPLLVSSIIIINYIIDPYQQYRQATFYTFDTKKRRYLNAGLIKNYSYNSLIIGSSMMANFDANKVEKKLNFSKSLKPLTFGGFISEEVDTIKTAMEYTSIKNIFMGLDFYAFSGFNIPSEKNKRFPLYLYDDDLYNDVEYLFNFSVLKESSKLLSKKYDKKKIEDQLDKLYDWQNDYNLFFTGEELLNDYKIKLSSNIKLRNFYNFEVMKNNFEQYLLPVIKENTTVNFVFFFPPYSILEYKLMDKEKYLLDTLKFKNYIALQFKNYNNIKLYDFQVANEITSNFRNYKDTTHYHKRINNWMLEQINQGNYLYESNVVSDDSFIDKIRLFNVQ